MKSRSADGPRTHRVSVDHDLCIGSGECIRLQPAAFRLDELAGVTDPLPAADHLDAAARQLAVTSCPMGAISVLEPGRLS